MIDLSPERLEKLLEKYAGDDVYLFNIASRKIGSLAPDLARQRIADAKRIAELEDEHFNLRTNLGTAVKWLISLVGPEPFESALKESQ